MGFFDAIWSILKKPLQIKRNYQELHARVHTLEQGYLMRDDILRRMETDLHNAVQSLAQADEHISVRMQSLAKADERADERLRSLEQLHSYQPQTELYNTGIKEDETYLSADCGKEENLDVLYNNIARIFRGDEDWLRRELERLVPYVKSTECDELPFVDCGCGQGIFLDILAEHGIKAIGVDFNPVSVKPALANGHDVVIGDAIEFLRKQEDDSLRGVSMIMVVEHIPFEKLFHDFFVFAKKTASGGVCVINTINTYCYRRMGAFCLDPSHVNFAPPDLYKIVMEMAGYVNVKLIWSVPVSGHSQPDEWYTQYENVSLIGYKP